MATPTLKQKMKTMTGYCTSCGAVIIDLAAPRPKILENYCEHTLSLSNGTLMRVGVCADCKEKLVSGKNVQATADAILENHKTYWTANRRGAPKGFADLTIDDPNTDFAKHRRRLLMERHAINVAQTKKDQARKAKAEKKSQ